MADKIKKVNNKLEIEFKESISNINTNNVEAMATAFATWLNLYFEIWSPNNNTWIDSNKHAYTTDELWEEFKKEVV